MFIRTIHTSAKHIIGKSTVTNLLNNKAVELWKSFMPLRKEIRSSINQNLFSLQIYPRKLEYSNFTPAEDYTLWAGVEVSDHTNIPVGLKVLKIPAGCYAIFLHKGTPRDFKKTMDYIFMEWLPRSEYEIDNRPHFEILGQNYKHNDPSSEEEVWIPIKKSTK